MHGTIVRASGASTRAYPRPAAQTFLKKLCREQGIPRWPFRQVRCIKDYLRRLEYLETLVNAKVTNTTRMRVRSHLPRIQEAKKQLQTLLQEVFENPSVLGASVALCGGCCGRDH